MKTYMETLRGMGCAVGEYVGDGQGESESVTQPTTSADLDSVDADPGVDDQSQVRIAVMMHTLLVAMDTNLITQQNTHYTDQYI